jgi:ABC-type antimicrobial peptide transport system permease subunit
MTLGATSGDVFSLLVRESLRPVIAGLAVGLVAALGSSRILASMLSGLSPHDPVSIGLAVAVLLAGAFAAVVAPARLAARIDPAGVLRSS